ncbi:MAG TPA: cytochrome c3 family protein [Thermoanaerobaculia bacterium]|jgi:hypothetical protein
MRSRYHQLALALGAFFGAALLAAGLAAEVPIEDCLACHVDETLTMTFDDGDEMSLFVDEETYLASVHGEALVCTDCHHGYEDDHPGGREIASRRDYVIASYDLCKQCHFDTYTRTLESVHYEYLSEGLDVVPVCADCHGAHDVQDPHEKSVMISRSCGTCHEDVYKVYKRSVHGAALSETNQDIPGCADCHTAHVIAHPDSVRFRLVSPETCMRCHGDGELTAKYGMLSTVATTYLADFHGVTASLAAASAAEPEQLVVVCIDCHGYHDIASPSLVGKEEMARRVEAACASCHEDATPDFSAAWLSHYPPDLDRAPLVFLVRLFYRVFIPFMVAGLLLQVGMHLYRVGSRR